MRTAGRIMSGLAVAFLLFDSAIKLVTHQSVAEAFPPLFSHTLFPICVAALIWGGLFVRESRLRELVPLRS